MKSEKNSSIIGSRCRSGSGTSNGSGRRNGSGAGNSSGRIYINTRLGDF